MAEKRKLQSDIEKALKRVDDGIEDFDNLLLKVEEAQTPAQKEKLEGELKRDIKKLQRLRDQIKGWLVAPEVKDKPPLEEARKNIEKEMEKFKVCEKLFKIKAFSKEGLAQERKLGPQEAEREKHRKWIRDSLERLNTEIDSHEAEIEKYKSQSKKGRIKGTDGDVVVQREQWVSRHKWHVAKLERVLRKLENDEIEPLSLLDDLNESVDYYLESYQDPEYYNDDELYVQYCMEESPEDQSFVLNRESDSLDGGDESGVEGPLVFGSLPSGESVSGSITDVTISTNKRKSITSSPSVAIQAPVRKMKVESGSEEADASATTMSGGATMAPSQGRPIWSPVVSYAAAAKSTVVPVHHETASQQSQTSFQQSQSAAQESCKPLENVWKSDKAERPPPQQQGAVSHQPSQGVQQMQRRAVASPPPPPMTQQRLGQYTSPNLDLLVNIVDVAFKNLPELKHRRHFRYYQPKTIWNNPPPSFPTFPLKDFATPQFFSRLDLDTLFFTFYHQQGTYQQYLAARELKRQNWRYHKKYLTWFQPQGGPKIVTDKFHRGSWVYFDSEAGWCSRFKHDFTFELSYLEDEMPVPPPLGSPGTTPFSSPDSEPQVPATTFPQTNNGRTSNTSGEQHSKQ